MAQIPSDNEGSDRVSELAARFEQKNNLDLDAMGTRRRGPSAMRPPAPAPDFDARRQSWAPGRAPPRKERARPPPRPIIAGKQRSAPIGSTVSPNISVTMPDRMAQPRPPPGSRSPARSPPSAAATPSDYSQRMVEGNVTADGPARVFGDTHDVEVPELEFAPLYPLIQQMERGSTTISEFAKSLGTYARSQIKQADAMSKLFEKTKKHYAEMDGMINFTFVLELVHQMLTQTVHLQAELAQYIEDVCLPIVNNVIKTSVAEQSRITKDYRRQEKSWRDCVNTVKRAQTQVNSDAQQFRLQQDGQRRVGGLRGILKKTKSVAPGEMDREEQRLYEQAEESARRYKQAIGEANNQRQDFLQSFFRSKQDICNMESTRIQSVLAVLQKLMEKSNALRSQPVIHQLNEDILTKASTTDPADEVRKFVQETVARGQWTEPDEFVFDVDVEYRDTWRSIDDAIEVTRETDPGAKVPRVVTTLCAKILELGGDRAEGIFRISGNKRTTDVLKKQLREGNYNEMTDPNPHLYAGLLKEWLRNLNEPLIPHNYYEVCVSMARDGSLSHDQFEVFLSQMPETNRETLKYLARFLRQLAQNEPQTKMGLPNFALVFAPCFLRCTSEDPAVMMANSGPEKEFVIALIENSVS